MITDAFKVNIILISAIGLTIILSIAGTVLGYRFWVRAKRLKIVEKSHLDRVLQERQDSNANLFKQDSIISGHTTNTEITMSTINGPTKITRHFQGMESTTISSITSGIFDLDS